MIRSLSLLDGMKEKVKTKPSSLFDAVKSFRKKKEPLEEPSAKRSSGSNKPRGFLKAIGAM